MPNSYELLDQQVSTAIVGSGSKTPDELRKMIVALNNMLPVIHGCPPVGAGDVERLAREVEERTGVGMGIGAMVDGEDFEPWLDDAKSKITPLLLGKVPPTYRQHWAAQKCCDGDRRSHGPYSEPIGRSEQERPLESARDGCRSRPEREDSKLCRANLQGCGRWLPLDYCYRGHP